MVQEHFFDDRESLLAALKSECIGKLKAGIETNGTASFMASGGSTPAVLYAQMSEEVLPWDKVSVALVDERWVDRDHEKSNEAFLYKTLLQNNAAGANYVPMKDDHGQARDAVIDCEARFADIKSPYDCLILGMGNDGHTASLFPFADGLDQALDLKNDAECAAIYANKSEVTGDITERMTLSLKGILNSEFLVLLLTGQDKLDTYNKAKAVSDVREMPIAAVLRQTEVPVHVYWAP